MKSARLPGPTVVFASDIKDKLRLLGDDQLIEYAEVQIGRFAFQTTCTLMSVTSRFSDARHPGDSIATGSRRGRGDGAAGRFGY